MDKPIERSELERTIHELACQRYGIKDDSVAEQTTYWFMGWSDAGWFMQKVTGLDGERTKLERTGSRGEGVIVRLHT